MRVWSLPVTKEKALKLWHLLEYRIGPKEAENHLFSLLGHEGLFEQLSKSSHDEDVRPYIRQCLKDMLWESPPCYQNSWQAEAKAICKAAVYECRPTVLC